MEIPLPPQPPAPKEDFTSPGATREGLKRRHSTLCPMIKPILGYATRDWKKPLSAKRPALGYAPYCAIQKWQWNNGVPAIEDGIWLNLAHSSSIWPGGKAALPLERDGQTMTVLDHCYANAAQVVALASNLAFIAGAVDKKLSSGAELLAENLSFMQTSMAAVLRMSQASTIDGGLHGIGAGRGQAPVAGVGRFERAGEPATPGPACLHDIPLRLEHADSV